MNEQITFCAGSHLFCINVEVTEIPTLTNLDMYESIFKQNLRSKYILNGELIFKVMYVDTCSFSHLFELRIRKHNFLITISLII